jgi:hypothetical protein
VYTVSYYERIRGNGYMDATLSVAAGTVIGASGSPVPVAAGPATSIVQTTAVNANWTHHTFTFTPNTTTTATITLGNHYDGTGGDNDGVFLDNVSVTATVIVGPRVSTATLTRHPGTGTSSPYGTALSFDVTVAGNFGTPVGTVTLKDGGSSGTTLGSATLTSGACTITTPTLALGTHPNIVAVYGGNSTYASSTSSPLSQTVISAPPDAPTGLTATPGASGAVMLTWNAPAGATGYKISIKNTAISAEQIVNTTASPYTATGLTNGTLYEFKVLGTNGAGDGAYSGVVSATPTAGVSSTTTLATLTPSTYGNPVTFTATVAPVPTGGTLQFYDNNVALGSPVAVNTSTGVAEYTTTALTAGSHPITATFSGTTGLIGSTASPKTQTVNPAMPDVTVNVGSYTYNGSAQGPNTATTGGSTGAVTFSYAGVNGTTYPASGTPPTHAGSYTCTATVTADPNYTSASSGATPFTIAKATPVITWATPSPIIVGTALGATQLNATSGGVAGNFVYTPASGVVLALGSHPLSVQFTPTVTANYNTPAATTVTIQVTVTSVVFGEEQYQANGADPSPIGVASGDLLETAGVVATNEPGTISGGVGPALRSGSFGDYVGYNDNSEYATTYLLAPSTLGYDITEIRLFSNGGSRTGQAYDIKYSLIGAPDTFLFLGTYTDTLYGGAGGTLMTRTYNPGGSAIRTGVAAIQFVIRPTKIVGETPARYHGALYREWDVLGTATVAASNYATWAAAQNPPLGDASAAGPDGLSNLLIYALAGLKTDHTNGSPGTLTGKLLSFTKRPEAVANKDVTYTIETSPDLGVSTPWTAVSAGDPALTNSDTTISYTLLPGQGRIFVRLLVTQ